ncbi:MAG: energy-coupling factor transporter transmembrane component T [Tissierellia bacterium]|nr:energy-coupling factor transporter transmembrane component T [Tissierellia bacterium]
MKNLDFRVKLLVFLGTVFLVAVISKDTVFFLLVLFLYVYLFLQREYSIILKTGLFLSIIQTINIITGGKGVKVILPEMFLFMTTRIIVVFTSAIPLLNTPPGEIANILKKLKLNRNIALPFIFMIRFFPTIINEFKEIFDSLSLRGILSIKKPLKSIEYVFVPMMFSASKTAEELAAAAEVRGISASGEHSSRREIKFSSIDFMISLIIIALIFLFLYLEGVFL